MCFVGDLKPVCTLCRTCVGPASDCHPALDAPFTLNLTVISTAPRAFLIEHFLSDAEVERRTCDDHDLLIRNTYETHMKHARYTFMT